MGLNIKTDKAKTSFHVALTGGIASGKTMVSEAFKDLGADIIDTDKIAHMITETGNDALKEITLEFGKEFLREDGNLNRQLMRQTIFKDPSKRRLLESIIHPKIHYQVQRELSIASGIYQIIVVPLLTKSPLRNIVDRVLVVDCDEKTQIERLKERDGESEDFAKKIIASQSSRSERMAIADDIIINNQDFKETLVQIKRLNKKYIEISAKQ
ncbi:MAG TPA: dephospho-CoA kinase [Woeseiaceae bacterium]|nr:dephospho-CoA kinase [Woeseiaceae bacterium]